MIIRVKTVTGSVYLLNKEKLTWARIEEGKDKGPNPMRTDGGEMLGWPEIKMDQGIKILGPPIDPKATFRLIYTSDVIEIGEYKPQ